MKGELFFSFWVRLHLPAARSLKKGNALKHLTWLDWNWIKLIKSYQRSRGLFRTVYATAAKSCLVPSEPLLTADPLAVVALFAKLVEEQHWSRVATGGRKRGTGTPEVTALALEAGAPFSQCSVCTHHFHSSERAAHETLSSHFPSSAVMPPSFLPAAL